MRKILFPLAAFALYACSSMEVADDFERYGNMLPPDFILAKFSEINPDIAVMQAMDAITTLNAAWETEQRNSGSDINALKKTDDSEFLTGDGLEIAKTYLKWSDEGVNNINSAKQCAGISIAANRIPQNYLCQLNIYGRSDELNFLKDFLKSEVDSSIIMQTYVMYGKKEGRPYRECKQSENANDERSKSMEGVVIGGSENSPTYNYSKFFFCEDNNGIVRKATDFGNN